MLFIFMMPFLLLLLFNFLIIKEETKRYWADTHLGSPLPTSSIHHQGEQEKEGQGPWESFIILNVRREGGEKVEKKKEQMQTLSYIQHNGVVREGTDMKLRQGWAPGVRVVKPNSFLSLMLFQYLSG